MLISQCHFDRLSEAHGPSTGPLKPTGPPEAHGPPNGPPKVHGLRVHCPPCSTPLVGPAWRMGIRLNHFFIRNLD